MKRKLISMFLIGLSFIFISCDGLTTTQQLTIEDTSSLTTEEVTDLTVTTEVNTVVTTNDLTEEQTTIDPVTEDLTTVDQITTEAPTEISTTVEMTTHEQTTVVPTTTYTTTEEVTTTWINPLIEINLFSINDFHGGAYTDMDMISGIGAYLKNFEGYHLEVSNGDIFQGSALSNYYHGRVLVDALNEGGFDGFVIGNHEFDWGIDVIEEIGRAHV